jgi:hypothetical protein
VGKSVVAASRCGQPFRYGSDHLTGFYATRGGGGGGGSGGTAIELRLPLQRGCELGLVLPLPRLDTAKHFRLLGEFLSQVRGHLRVLERLTDLRAHNVTDVAHSGSWNGRATGIVHVHSLCRVGCRCRGDSGRGRTARRSRSVHMTLCMRTQAVGHGRVRQRELQQILELSA